MDFRAQDIAQGLEAGIRGFLQANDMKQRQLEAEAAKKSKEKNDYLRDLTFKMQAEKAGYKTSTDPQSGLINIEKDPSFGVEQREREQAERIWNKVTDLQGKGYDVDLSQDQQGLLDKYGYGLLNTQKGAGLLQKDSDNALKRKKEQLQVQKLEKDLYKPNLQERKQRALFKQGKMAEDQYRQAVMDGVKEGWDPTEYSISNTDLNIPFTDINLIPQGIRANAAVRARSAEGSWVENFLRDASGAAIPNDERERYALQFFPRPGDDLKTVIDKARKRKLKMKTALEGGDLSFDPDNPNFSSEFASSPPQVDKPIPMGHVRVWDGFKLLDIPEDDLEKARIEGFEKVSYGK